MKCVKAVLRYFQSKGIKFLRFTADFIVVVVDLIAVVVVLPVVIIDEP